MSMVIKDIFYKMDIIDAQWQILYHVIEHFAPHF